VKEEFPNYAFLAKKSIDYGTNEWGVTESLLWNAGLLLHFFLTHIFLASTKVKEILGMNTKGLSLYRTLYNLQSVFCLWLIMEYWKPVFTDMVLWNLPAKYILPFTFFGIALQLFSEISIDAFNLLGIS